MSVPYFGDFAEDATVYIPFNTFDSNDPQASVTITNLVDADIKVHKDAGLTQIVTDGATISIDYDAITGNHMATIDTSASADYAIGSDYMVRIEGTTVDAGTINAWIGTFSIENRYNDVNVVTVSGTAQTANDNGADLNTLITRIAQTLNLTALGNIGLDWANVENPTTAVDLAGTDIQLADTITTYTGNTPQTADHTANIAAILVDTNELQTDDVPGLIAALNDIAASDVLTQVNAALDTAISELGVAAPAATPTLRTGLMLMYMVLRNKTVVQTSGTDALEVYNDAGTKIASKLLSDDGSDFTEAEMT